MNDLHSECSCPYGINCKHGVAVLLQYMDGEYSDADKVTKSLDRMSRVELRGIIDSLINANPTNLMYLGIQAEVNEKPDGNLMEALEDFSIKSYPFDPINPVQKNIKIGS